MTEQSLRDAAQRIQDLMRQGSVHEAEACCCALINELPKHAVPWLLLGQVRMQAGRFLEGQGAFQASATRDATNPAAWRGLGACFFALRNWTEAADAFRQAAVLEPGNPANWSNLGGAEQNLNHWAAARDAYERSLSLDPERPGTITNYATLLTKEGHLEQAIGLFRDVLAKDPHLAAAWCGLGTALRALERYDEAAVAHRRAWELAPHQFEMRYQLAWSLLVQWKLDEAERLARQAIDDQPELSGAWALLGSVLLRKAHAGEAIQALNHSVQLSPDAPQHSSLLCALQYVDGVDESALLEAHRQWNEIHARRLIPSSSQAIQDREGRPLRIGFVSADLCQHPAGFLSLRGFESIDRTQCSLYFYSDLLIEDAFSARFRSCADSWQRTCGFSDEALAEQIRSDEIDVLVDLMGHTGARLLTFARKPAPVQVTWLGYVGTTGVEAIDFILADRFHIPPGNECHHVEKVLRMPRGYCCYTPPDDAPSISALPATTAGCVTFGCFNNPKKYSANIIDAWAQVLKRVPHSRLLLKFGGLDEPRVQNDLWSRFLERGVGRDRILLEGHGTHRQLLAAYGRVDLAFDTQPYSGGLTTCEALWMGVPVITCPGETFAGRHSLSHLTNAGFPQFVAPDLRRYVDYAVSWSDRLSELAALRMTMREAVWHSALCDAPQFANDLVNVLKETVGSVNQRR